MAVRTVVLDAQALYVLAHPRASEQSATRVRDVVRAAHEQRAVVRVPAAVLVEVCRDPTSTAAVNRLTKKRVGVITTGEKMAKVAGALLGRYSLDSCHAIDAMVVATALHLGGALILTSDQPDLERLAERYPAIRVQRI
jgi:predicted nucleic acid-binding protein